MGIRGLARETRTVRRKRVPMRRRSDSGVIYLSNSVTRMVEFTLSYWEDQIAGLPQVITLRERQDQDVAATNAAFGTLAGEMCLAADVSRYLVARVRVEIEHPQLFNRLQPYLADATGRVHIDRLLVGNKEPARPRGRPPCSVALVGDREIPVEAPTGNYTLRDGTRVEVVSSGDAGSG